MIIVLLNLYIAILAVLVWLKVIRLSLFWKISPLLVLAALLLGFFIPMNWGAPSGRVLVGRHSVGIVPNIAGEVIEVVARPNVPLKAGDVLFRIDPSPYEAQRQALEAQLQLAEIRLGQARELFQRQSGSEATLQQRQAEVDQLKAQYDGARWNVDKATVRAPTDGYVTNLALRKGARVAALPLAPVMAFIDTSEMIALVEIQQSAARYVRPGQSVELTLKFLPGRIVPAKVEAVLQAVVTGQVAPGGFAAGPLAAQAVPFTVRVKLDDPAVEALLPAGSVGVAAIYTDRAKASQPIRRILMRQTALLNYVLPF